MHPADYNEVIERIKSDRLDEAFRKELMIKVFAHTNEYDHAIVSFFKGDSEQLRYGKTRNNQRVLSAHLQANIPSRVLSNYMVKH